MRLGYSSYTEKITNTVEFSNLHRKREIGVGGGDITEKYIQGKQKLVEEIETFEKPRVREIGFPLYSEVLFSYRDKVLGHFRVARQGLGQNV